MINNLIIEYMHVSLALPKESSFDTSIAIEDVIDKMESH